MDDYDSDMDEERPDEESALDFQKDVCCNTSRLLFNSSLVNLCMNAIAKNQKHFAFRADTKVSLAQLDLHLRKKLIKKIIDFKSYSQTDEGDEYDFDEDDEEETVKKDATFELIRQLMDHKITEYCLDWFNDEDDLSNKLLHTLVDKFGFTTQKLVQKERDITSGMDRDKSFNMKANKLDCLLHLPNLQHLEIHCNLLSNEQLQLIGQKLSNLVFLGVDLMDPDKDSVSRALEPLKKLEVFIFRVYSLTKFGDLSERNASALCGHCLLRFPQLKVIGSKVDNESEEDPEEESKFLHLLDDYNQLLAAGQTRQLQHLIISKPLTRQQAANLPNLTHLKVLTSANDNIDMEGLLHFDKLKGLSFVSQNYTDQWRPLMKLIRKYGSGLEYLSISFLESRLVNIDKILFLCPNVKTMHLNFNGTGGPSVHQLHQNAMANLTALSVDFFNINWAPGVMAQFFTAPNLKHLTMWSVSADENSLGSVMEHLRGKVVAPKLAILYGSSRRWNGIYKLKEAYWRQFLQFLCLEAPVLETIHFFAAVLDDNFCKMINCRARLVEEPHFSWERVLNSD
ncbi:uncharacterized protein LOC132198914 [Neocloeon triangulifer]|uniref:uncharacterized protein LOC132198914 n=1 Tax=Neocloeon triangulifer TaxID=2078957 RepID=UPI00286F49CD|nr:uncharacterized protein LOC132198914 [Neocloeon triangulifer]